MKDCTQCFRKGMDIWDCPNTLCPMKDKIDILESECESELEEKEDTNIKED